jgi:lactate permease
MSLPPINLLYILLAALPILVVLYLMVGRNWGGSKAGPAGWLAAVLVAVLFFGAGTPLLLVAWGKAILLALFVLYIIWMALLLYHTVNEAGVIAAIGREMPGLAKDKPGQALLLAWVFGSFLQGATGFGVPAAVVAPLLVGLGFAANTAVVLALLGHAWAVTYGSLGSSFVSLIATTGLPGEMLATPAAALLGVCCLGCGLGVLWLAGGRVALRQRGLLMLVLTFVMSLAQWGIAVAGLWTVAAFGGGLAGLIAIIFYFTRLTRNQPADQSPFDGTRLAKAFLPYGLLILVILLGQIPLKEFLGMVQINPVFPEVATRFGWRTAAGTGRSLNLFGHAGALLLYVSLLTFAWYRRQGTLKSGDDAGTYSGRLIWRKTLRGSLKPTIGIYSLVAMALTMQHAGMTQILATALSANTGPIFPFLSPFIGALGAFMTGSNTNSNVVFGQLQQQTASALNLSIPLILAAQTAGGAVGSLFAPAKVLVGVSTVPGADDGQVLKLATAYGLAIILGVGLLVWLIAWLAPQLI